MGGRGDPREGRGRRGGWRAPRNAELLDGSGQARFHVETSTSGYGVCLFPISIDREVESREVVRVEQV